MSILLVLGAALAGTCAGGQSAAGQATDAAPPRSIDIPTAQLDEFVGEVMRTGDVPGAAVAVVREGRVVALRTYGVRELGRPERVDADTIFDIASLTKSFTAALVATLVDEGRMGWDDPVRKHLPEIQFPDPYLTAAVTVRDLLCHRTGLATTDSAWYFSRLTRPEVLRLAAGLTMQVPFRTGVVYSNIGYTIAGEAAAAAGGGSWEDLIANRLLRPLGMTRSTADFDAAPAMGNLATGHQVLRGVQRPLPRETTRMSTAAAGAVQASITDVATWMRFQLGDGSFNGRVILKPGRLDEMRAPQIIVPTTPEFRAARQLHFFAAYGLGWQVFDYRGRPMVWHSGSGDGQRVYMALLPEQHLGVAVLFNTKAAPTDGVGLVAGYVLDHYLREVSSNYLAPFAQTMERRRAQWAAARAAPSQAPISLPTALQSFTGRYVDRLGLQVHITAVAGGLRMTYGGGERAVLEYREHGVFIAHWENPGHDEESATAVSFSFDDQGRAVRLHMEPFEEPVDAVRVAEAAEDR